MQLYACDTILVMLWNGNFCIPDSYLGMLCQNGFVIAVSKGNVHAI